MWSLNRRTATWNLFVLYNKETSYYSFLISKLLESRPLFTLATTKKKPFDVICCLYKMKQSDWLLCMHNKDLTRLKQGLDSNGFSWKENLQGKQNWNAKSTNVKEDAGKIRSIIVIRAALWTKKLQCCLKYCWS